MALHVRFDLAEFELVAKDYTPASTVREVLAAHGIGSVLKVLVEVSPRPAAALAASNAVAVPYCAAIAPHTAILGVWPTVWVTAKSPVGAEAALLRVGGWTPTTAVMVRAEDGPFVGLPLDAGAGGMPCRALVQAAGRRVGAVGIVDAYMLKEVVGLAPTAAELGISRRVYLSYAEGMFPVQEVLRGVRPTNNCVWLTLVTRGY